MRRSVGSLRWAAAALLLGCFLACRQLVGITDGPPEATAGACGIPYATPACASCAAAKCCDVSSACAATGACSSYEACLAGCEGEPTCRAQCAVDHAPGTADEIPALDTCLFSSCASACGLGCGSITEPSTPPDAAVTCESCLGGSVCGVESACAASVDCEAYVRCENACTTYDCQEACGLAHDAGVALFEPVGDQMGGSCAAACAFGADWLCVGNVSWPALAAPTTTLYVAVTEQPGGAPLPGASVVACGVDDYQCLSPLAQPATSDATGEVVLQVPTFATHPYGMYLQMTPPPGDGGVSPFVTTLAYLRSPLSEPSKHAGVGAYATAFVNEFYASAGLTPDPTRGSLLATAEDCNLHPAAGAQLTTSAGPAVRVYYGLDLQATATPTNGSMTMGNVPTGLLTLALTPPGGNQPSSQASVFVRPGAVTNVTLLPTP